MTALKQFLISGVGMVFGLVLLAPTYAGAQDAQAFLERWLVQGQLDLDRNIGWLQQDLIQNQMRLMALERSLPPGLRARVGEILSRPLGSVRPDYWVYYNWWCALGGDNCVLVRPLPR